MLPKTCVLKAVILILQASSTVCAYKLTKTYDYRNFFDGFYFRDRAYYDSLNPGYHGDPTDGSVLYLSKDQALKAGIVNTNNQQVYLGADSTHKAALRDNDTSLHARPSVRLESKDTWSSGLLIADIAHMPGTACGSWPSLWAYNFEEDPVGEIDIIEGTNLQTKNVVSLHTCGSCSFTKIGGTENRANCNNGGTLSQQCEDGTNYDGCGNTMSKSSYGVPFNARGGGVYAVSLAANAVKIYWWPRNSIPADITNGKPDPTNWGTPASLFTSGSNCNVSKYFRKLSIIINLTFCGDNIDQDSWEQDCQASTGAKTCDNYVANYPQAFKNEYWKFNSIKLYQ